MFNTLRKQKTAFPLPTFDQEAADSSVPEAALITNFEELEDIQITTNADILTETQKMNGACPGFIAEDAQLYWADSSHKCNKRFRFSIFLNQLREYLPRGLKPQAFARPMVHLIDRGAHLVLAELVEGHAFGEVLA